MVRDCCMYHIQLTNWVFSNLFSFIGKGIISCPPPKVWEVLKEPENAYRYNNMLKVSD